MPNVEDIAAQGFTSVLLSKKNVFVCGWYNGLSSRIPIRVCQSDKSSFQAVARGIFKSSMCHWQTLCQLTCAKTTADRSLNPFVWMAAYVVLFTKWLLKVSYPPPLFGSERANPFVRALNDEDTCDITFIVENKKIYAHSCILKIRSDYFRKMFNAKFKETKTWEIHVEDTPYDVLFAYLLYIYSYDVNAAGDDLMDLFELSHKYCDEAE